MSNAPSSPATPAAAPKAEAKTPLEKLLTSTPVIMTIIATVLAGMSAGELTRSQYQRTLAAQSQSKVSDEWALFQARRMRSTLLENTGDLFQAQLDTARIDAPSLRRYSEDLPADLKRLGEEADRLLQHAKAAQADLGTSGDPLTHKLLRFQEIARAQVKPAEDAKKKIGETLEKPDGKKALEFLGGDELPAIEGQSGDPRNPMAGTFEKINPAIKTVVEMIEKNERESAIEKEVAKITRAQLQEALEISTQKSAAFDQVCKPTNNIIRDLDRQLNRQRQLLRPLYRAAQECVQTLGQPPAGAGKTVTDVHLACQNLLNGVSQLKAGFQETNNDFKAAKLDYNSRRYDRESRYNQAVAGLYEIQVRQYGLTSDGLRTRSKWFFYGMLAAQAGVTIATFSLALRYKSLLLALAYAAGVTALSIAISAWVLL